MDRLKKRLLLVEDDLDIAHTLKEILEMEGSYVVFHVTDGQSALDLADHNPELFHMALVDLIIPGPKGDEIAKVFRERKLMTPTLLMSGAGMEWINNRFDIEVADAFIKKPFDLDHLFKLISDLADKHADRKAA